MRIKAIVVRIITQFIRDLRTLGLLILAPMMILLLVNVILTEDTKSLSIAVYEVPNDLKAALENLDISVKDQTKEEALLLLNNQKIDAFLSFKNSEPQLILEGSDVAVSNSINAVIQKALSNINSKSPNLSLDITYLYGSNDMTLFDQIGSILIGFFIFFFVFLIGGVSFLRERTTGTLERLMATPVKRWEVVVGYIIGFGIFTTIQAAIISWFSINVLGVLINGSFIHVLIITFLLAMSALTLGMLLSTFAKNELQVIQFIPIVIVPQFFFSGIFNIEALPDKIRYLSYIMPVKYGADALKDIMIRGKDLSDLFSNIIILSVISIVFMVLNIFALKKYKAAI